MFQTICRTFLNQINKKSEFNFKNEKKLEDTIKEYHKNMWRAYFITKLDV